jgi:nucleotide-binding universal stress UspA family protein
MICGTIFSERREIQGVWHTDEHLPYQDPLGHGRLRGGPARCENCRRARKEHWLRTTRGSVFLWARPSALDPISMDTTVHEAVESRARERLKKIVRRIEASGGAVQGSYLKGGEPDAEIVALGEEIGAGLIVMGSRGLGGMRRALTGTVSDSVVRHAHCPVMVVRGEPVVFPTTILLATDGSENANLAAAAAADLAKSTNSELHVVYVGGMPSVFYESPGAIVLDPDL